MVNLPLRQLKIEEKNEKVMKLQVMAIQSTIGGYADSLQLFLILTSTLATIKTLDSRIPLCCNSRY